MTELYLYQTIHLLGGHPRLVAEHAALLDEASRALFNRPYTPDTRQLTARIAAAAVAAGYPRGVSCFVRLELTPEGGERITPAGVSLYSGYALRSLLPDAVTVVYDNPLTDAPTSTREAAAGLARLWAENAGAAVAVRCNAEGQAIAADDAPLLAVRGREIVTPPAARSVERDLVMQAVRAAGIPLVEEPLECAALGRFDELFYADHRGVTALAHCDSHPYMALLAERVAAAMEQLFGAKQM